MVTHNNNQSSYTQGMCSFLTAASESHRHTCLIDSCKLGFRLCLPNRDKNSNFFLKIRNLQLWYPRRFPIWAVCHRSQWWRAALCWMESSIICHQCRPSVCCDALVLIWVQPAGPFSSGSCLLSHPHPHRWCVHADSVSQLHHADLHTRTFAH